MLRVDIPHHFLRLRIPFCTSAGMAVGLCKSNALKALKTWDFWKGMHREPRKTWSLWTSMHWIPRKMWKIWKSMQSFSKLVQWKSGISVDECAENTSQCGNFRKSRARSAKKGWQWAFEKAQKQAEPLFLSQALGLHDRKCAKTFEHSKKTTLHFCICWFRSTVSTRIITYRKIFSGELICVMWSVTYTYCNSLANYFVLCNEVIVM